MSAFHTIANISKNVSFIDYHKTFIVINTANASPKIDRDLYETSLD